MVIIWMCYEVYIWVIARSGLVGGWVDVVQW